jgi:lipopolysaccharide/colanic/teichoic acid biosynthesis glycosyltransferase
MSDFGQALKVTAEAYQRPSESYWEKPVPRRRSNIRLVSSQSLLTVPAPSIPTTIRSPLQSGLKRSFDLVGAIAMLVLLSPVMATVWIALRLTSKGPAILSQVRLTQGGKHFKMYKFRSMRLDAERHSGPVLAKVGDDRVTPVGKIIRRTRLDELPQLVNVIMGDMSLIGPRPERPEIAEQLRTELPSFDRRLAVKAGLTGLAQVNLGYSACTDSYRRKVALDRVYVQRQSLLLDTWIAIKTVVVMITGHGAR